MRGVEVEVEEATEHAAVVAGDEGLWCGVVWWGEVVG